MAKDSQIVQGQAGDPGRSPTSAGDKVTVACNLPHGVLIRAHKMRDYTELGTGGLRIETRIAEPYGEPIKVFGNAVEVGKIPVCKIVAGYALTPGVDKEYFDAWFEANKDTAMVRNKCIFAYASLDRAEDAAEDNRGRRSGLEPFAMENDSRRPIPRGNLSGVTTAERQ